MIVRILQRNWEAEEMDEKWSSTPALRALAPGVLKQLQGYQEEADALFKETQATTACAPCCAPLIALMSLGCTVHGERDVEVDQVLAIQRQKNATLNGSKADKYRS